MKRLCIVGLAAALPMTAEAGWGLTNYSSIEHSGDELYYSPGHTLPSLDWKGGGILIQVDMLETIASVTRDDDIFFGLNAYQTVRLPRDSEINDNVQGVVQLGGTFDYDQAGQDLSYLTAMASMRVGAQAQKKMGFGMYVVPQVGLNILTGDADAVELAREDSIEIAVGGQLQISVWATK